MAPITEVRSQPPIEMPIASRPKAPALIDLTKEEVHIGVLLVNEILSPLRPSEYCLDDNLLWKGAAYRLGDINIFGLDKDLAPLIGSNPIAIWGAKKQGLDSQLRDAGPCPSPYEPVQVQMRSDWLPPEGGPNTTHARLAELSYLEGVRVQAIEMAEFLDGDATTANVRLHNPFTQNFAGLKIEAHYEGGPGKPTATLVEQVMAIEPGESAELHIPRTLGGKQPRRKSGSGLHSLELSGRLGKAEIDIVLIVPRQAR